MLFSYPTNTDVKRLSMFAKASLSTFICKNHIHVMTNKAAKMKLRVKG